ncbi:MAG: valine--tRNA ligase [Ruminococcaceae bacterium]|nr:valine--tRNA ligase [Oscillospiraceae bacterium]
MRKELDKSYNPSEIEKPLYQKWCDAGYFTPEIDKSKKPFTIVIPPPNVTGQLHMGHALDETLQDTIIRFKRMSGYCTLWVPGTDHAGIATQIKVEENLRKEQGLSRYDLGREKFTEMVWDWKHKYGHRIIEQLKALGSSCDWTREHFTMDETLSKAVRKNFVDLYNKGLIYRGFRISNFCPKCATALSDAEVEYKEKDGSFWHLRYPVKDSDEYVIVATTRPETMLGDTAVAVHPDDERYAHLVGKTLILPLVGREIPVVADEYVEKDFGTGCVKITPCHDPNDFEVGKRHDLEMITVIDEHAKVCGGYKYDGMDRYEARKAIVADLDAGGYLVKIETCKHNVGHCHRCGTALEPLASRQWYVKMEPLVKEAIRVVEEGDIRFIPDRFSKLYLNWMYGIRDWCISRQLWWGHRIPAFYCDDCGEISVSETDLTVCPKCGSTHVHQEEDVLDTWFSSALWPFSTLGWPEKTDDLDFFYPTATLVTGYDIISFWVSRMITMGMENMKEKPFSNVFIHGLVRDAEGRKMSKSLGNGIDPLEIIDTCGADALRFALLTGNSPGNDMRFSPEKIEAARNFTNKIWNASRFALMNIPAELEDTALPTQDDLRLEDKWIISKFNKLASEVAENLDKYELGVALSKIYDFLWNVLCDWYIEVIKPRLFSKEGADYENACRVLSYVLRGAMELLHPFMPFITETIWQALPHDGESIVIAPYPVRNEALIFEKEETSMELLITAIRQIRNRRAEMNVPPSKKAKVIIVSSDKETFSPAVSAFFEKLAGAASVEYHDKFHDDSCVQIISDKAIIYIPLAEIIDFEKEITRLEAEKKKLLSEIERIDKKLANKGFVAKAPTAVIEGEKNKKVGYADKLASVEASLAKYKK